MLDHRPVDREDGGSIPPPPFRSFGNFVHPTLPLSFEETVKAVGLFYLVSMPREVKDPTHGNGKKHVMDSLTLESSKISKQILLNGW